MLQKFNIPEVLRTRSARHSFHLVSETHVRIEYRRMKDGDLMGPFSYGGDLVVTCHDGSFTVTSQGVEERLDISELLVVPTDTLIDIACRGAGVIQLIWAPAHAPTHQE
jgi:hypothetical protein